MKRLYIFFFLLVAFWFESCSESCSSNVSKNKSFVNQDSIDALRKKINADEKAKLLDSLFKYRVKTQGFNGSVLVAQSGEIIYKNAFGFADINKKDSLKINSPFQLASISKTLTATAVLLLKDRGKLSLDDDVVKFFPHFPYKNITIKLLLTHRSGLPNYVYSCEQYCEKPNNYNGKVFDNKAMLELLIDKKPEMAALPNKKFEYCNTNYALLALIVENVSGQSFSDFMSENIFVPLAMKDSWVKSPKYDSLHQQKTIGHKSNGKYEDDCFADDIVGDKSIYSTVEDMFKFERSWQTGSLLKPQTIKEAYTGYSNEHKGKRNYGLGWRIINDGKNPAVIYHNGWWHCYNTLFYRIPDKEITIIVFSNKYNKGVYQTADILQIVDKLSDSSVESEQDSL